MSKQIGGEFIAVPYRSALEIAFDGVPIDASPAFFYYITVKSPYSQIGSDNFAGSPKGLGFNTEIESLVK